MHNKSLIAAAAAATTMVMACNAQSDAEVRSGAELYANHCASCHGDVGEGDGPVAGVIRVNVPNLRTLSMRNNGEFPADDLRAFIDGRDIPAAHGDRYMPVWGDVFGWEEEDSDAADELVDRRIDAIVDYVRELQYR